VGDGEGLQLGLPSLCLLHPLKGLGVRAELSSSLRPAALRWRRHGSCARRGQLTRGSREGGSGEGGRVVHMLVVCV